MKNEKGALLLELLVSVCLFAFVGSEMANFWVSSSGWFRTVRDRANLDREVRVARELLMDPAQELFLRRSSDRMCAPR